MPNSNEGDPEIIYILNEFYNEMRATNYSTERVTSINGRPFKTAKQAIAQYVERERLKARLDQAQKDIQGSSGSISNTIDELTQQLRELEEHA